MGPEGMPGAAAGPTGAPNASGGLPPELMAMLAGGAGPVSPEMNSPMMQDLAAMGAPPVPAAGEGGIVL
jgi:hypothetical protein